jgi:hypothetical protein
MYIDRVEHGELYGPTKTVNQISELFEKYISFIIFINSFNLCERQLTVLFSVRLTI